MPAKKKKPPWMAWKEWALRLEGFNYTLAAEAFEERRKSRAVKFDLKKLQFAKHWDEKDQEIHEMVYLLRSVQRWVPEPKGPINLQIDKILKLHKVEKVD